MACYMDFGQLRENPWGSLDGKVRKLAREVRIQDSMHRISKFFPANELSHDFLSLCMGIWMTKRNPVPWIWGCLILRSGHQLPFRTAQGTPGLSLSLCTAIIPLSAPITLIQKPKANDTFLLVPHTLTTF